MALRGAPALPVELQAYILVHALDEESSSITTLCKGKILKLICLSKALHFTVTKLLYRELHIPHNTKKDVLKGLARALRRNSKLPRLVHALVVGSKDLSMHAKLAHHCLSASTVHEVLRLCAPVKLCLYISLSKEETLSFVQAHNLRHLELCLDCSIHRASALTIASGRNLLSEVIDRLDYLSLGSKGLQMLSEASVPKPPHSPAKLHLETMHCHSLIYPEIDDANEDEDEEVDEDAEEEAMFQINFDLYRAIFGHHGSRIRRINISGLQSRHPMSGQVQLSQFGQFPHLEILDFNLSGEFNWHNELLDLDKHPSIKRLNFVGAILYESQSEYVQKMSTILAGMLSAPRNMKALRTIDCSGLYVAGMGDALDWTDLQVEIEPLIEACTKKGVELILDRLNAQRENETI